MLPPIVTLFRSRLAGWSAQTAVTRIPALWLLSISSYVHPFSHPLDIPQCLLDRTHGQQWGLETTFKFQNANLSVGTADGANNGCTGPHGPWQWLAKGRVVAAQSCWWQWRIHQFRTTPWTQNGLTQDGGQKTPVGMYEPAFVEG